MKKSIGLAAMIGIVSLVVGCTQTSEQVVSPQPAVEQQQPAQVDSYEKIDEQTLPKLLGHAYASFSVVMSGGGPIPPEPERFDYQGTTYRYLGTDMDTREELVGYLSEAYTPEAVEEMLTKYRFIEHEGKMAQPEADGGTLLGWQDAQASMIDGDDEERTYELKVPIAETDGEFELKTVKVRRIEGKGWRVDQELQ